MNKEPNGSAPVERDVRQVKARIEAYLMQCAPHVKQREAAQLLIAANDRISDLEKALLGLFDNYCIPEHRRWPNRMEDAVQRALKVLHETPNR